MKDNKITLKTRHKYAKISLSPEIFTYFWSKNLKNITTVDFELTFGNANAHNLGFYLYYIEEVMKKKLAKENQN